MIVWGGLPDDVEQWRADTIPSTDSWTATSTMNAPAARSSHTAVWTGTQMIIWGGYVLSSEGELNTGGLYNPNTNTWAGVIPPTRLLPGTSIRRYGLAAR